MDNITFSNKGKKETKESAKQKNKKVDYIKEIADLEKTLEKIQDKYELNPNNHISGASTYLRACIESLKKSI